MPFLKDLHLSRPKLSHNQDPILNTRYKTLQIFREKKRKRSYRIAQKLFNMCVQPLTSSFVSHTKGNLEKKDDKSRNFQSNAINGYMASYVREYVGMNIKNTKRKRKNYTRT